MGILLHLAPFCTSQSTHQAIQYCYRTNPPNRILASFNQSRLYLNSAASCLNSVFKVIPRHVHPPATIDCVLFVAAFSPTAQRISHTHRLSFSLQNNVLIYSASFKLSFFSQRPGMTVHFYLNTTRMLINNAIFLVNKQWMRARRALLLRKRWISPRSSLF